MNAAERKSLQRATVHLVKNMNPNSLKTVMFACNLLNQDELERIDLPDKTTRDKNLFIIKTLPTKGSRAFGLFLNCLQQTSAENPVHLELKQLLEDGVADFS